MRLMRTFLHTNPNSSSHHRHKSNCSIQGLFLHTHPLQSCQVARGPSHPPTHGKRTQVPGRPLLSPAPENAGQNMSTQHRTQRWLCGPCPQHALKQPQLYTMYLGVALNFWYPLMTCRAHSRPEHHHLSAANASRLLHFVKALPIQPGWLHKQVITVQVPCQPGA